MMCCEHTPGCRALRERRPPTYLVSEGCEPHDNCGRRSCHRVAREARGAAAEPPSVRCLSQLEAPKTRIRTATAGRLRLFPKEKRCTLEWTSGVCFMQVFPNNARNVSRHLLDFSMHEYRDGRSVWASDPLLVQGHHAPDRGGSRPCGSIRLAVVLSVASKS